MRDFVRCLGLMLGISLRADPVRSTVAFATAVAQSVSSPLRAIGFGLLANGAATHDEHQAVAGALLTVGLSALARLMGWVSLTVRMRLRENTELYLDSRLMALTTGIPGIAHHELPEYLDRVELIRRERHYLANPFNPIAWLAAAVFQVVTVIGLLAAVDPLLALLPLAGLPAALVQVWAERRNVAQWEVHVERWRQLRLLMELDTRPAAAKEVRLYGLSDELIERRRRTYKQLDAEWLRLETRTTGMVWLAWLVFAAAFGAALAGTAHLAQQGEITVGQFVVVLTLCGLISGQVQGLTWNITWFVRTYKAVGRLIWFRRYADTVAADAASQDPAPTPDRLVEGIAFEGVSFRYPGTERAILDGIDVNLPAGSTVALVGENGAGKTTLIKLLTRLYDPSEGRITADGVDLRRIDVVEWRERASASFQDFGQLKLLARESVGVGDVAVVDSEPHVLDGLERAAATDVLGSLPDGLATQLGVEFDDGVDLSTGQWQKLALGRAMMREAPLLLVLDEPTASLDATTEHALFERFAGAAREAAERTGAITILVSHRFSTVRMADLIVVIDEGRIVEAGSHDELIANDGSYAELFRLQAAGYR